MLGRMLETIKQRSFRGIQEKTKKLDPVTRKNLQEFLEDIPEEQEELKLIEEELDKVRVNLARLREKEAFVGMRLVSYRKQVQDLSAQQPNSAAAAVALETTQKFTVALEQIAKSHESMINDIRMLEERIHSMEQRKYELKYKTEECQVVLETTEALQRQEKDLEEEEAAAAAASAAASAAEQNDSPGIIQVEMATTSSSSKQAVSDCDDLHLEEGLVVSQEEA